MFDWNDLRFFIAVARTGSGSRAAEQLNVNQSTVSRRIAALEDRLGIRLFERSAHGLSPSPEAVHLQARAEEIERIALEIERETAARRDAPEGVVRVATVEEIAATLIAPALPEFRRQWPGIKIDLLTGVRVLDLVRGEADVSLRLIRPTQTELFAKKVGEFGYGVYAASTYLQNLSPDRIDQITALDWMVLEDSLSISPEGPWLKRHLVGVKPILKCTSIKTLIAAVQAGMGVALLPRPSAYFYPGLERLPIDTREARTEIWLVVHQDAKRRTIVQAVMDFLIQVINKPLKKGPAAKPEPSLP